MELIQKIRALIPNFSGPAEFKTEVERKVYGDAVQYVLSEYVVPTRNSFGEYMDMLGIDIEQLGTDVLDLGAGMDEKFSKQATEYGLNVFSVNPKLLLKKYRNEVKMPIDGIEWQRKSIAAMAQNLPFKDEVFDSIVAVESVPGYLDHTYEAYYDTFREMVRVLKPGGSVFINISVFLDQEQLQTYRTVFSQLNELYGVQFRFPHLESKGIFLEDFENSEKGMYTDMIVTRTSN